MTNYSLYKAIRSLPSEEISVGSIYLDFKSYKDKFWIYTLDNDGFLNFYRTYYFIELNE